MDNDPAAVDKVVCGEDGLESKKLVFETASLAEDWDADIARIDGTIDESALITEQLNSKKSERTHNCLLDAAVSNKVNIGFDGGEKEGVESESSDMLKDKVEVSSINSEIDAVDGIKCGQESGKELGASCVIDDMPSDKTFSLSRSNGQDEHAFSSNNGHEIDLHGKGNEHFLLSGSIDGRNTWDPAILWAESFESKRTSLISQSDYFSGYEISVNNGLHPIDLKRNIEKAKLECDSYALFELAKEVLSRSFDERDEKDSNIIVRPHKQLQLTAFEISVFSLRLHNFISPKWLSRTYSSHVSWVADKCTDIGSAAIQKLNDCWEEVLTPSEVIDISSRASRSGDHLLQHAAAELAVSCLAHSHTLNPGEIQQAIDMCKEQDIELLERACASVETSSRNGGILPEILFYVARQWQYIHEKLIDYSIKQCNKGQTISLEKHRFDGTTLDKKEHVRSSSRPTYHKINAGDIHNTNPGKILISDKAKGLPNVKLHPTQSSHNPSAGDRYQFGCNKTPSAYDDFSVTTLLNAEQFVQQQMHRVAEEILIRNNSYEYHSPKLKPSSNTAALLRMNSQFPNPVNHTILVGKASGTVYNSDKALKSSDSEASIQLQTAFRVGIKAMEALALRRNEDRVDVKYSQSTPCSDDIRWLCALTASLGPPFLCKFCKTVTSSVSSPFVLHDLALEAARHFAMYNPAQLASYLRSPAVSPIVGKCLTLYSDLVRRDLAILNQSGYPDFVELLRKARSAFCMAPGGMIRFNELLEMVRKSCPRKGDLWQHIMNGLSRA